MCEPALSAAPLGRRRLRHRELSSLELRELDYKVSDGQDRRVERTLEARARPPAPRSPPARPAALG